MKKSILVLYLGFSSCFAFSQIQWDPEAQEARLDTVIQADGQTKDQLYEKIRIWVASNLKSADNQVFYDEEKHESIIATGNLILKNTSSFGTVITNRILGFKMSVFIKESRYKVVVGNLTYAETRTVITAKGSNVYNHLNGLNDYYQRLWEKDQKRIQKGKSPDKPDNLEVEFGEAILGLVRQLENSVNQGDVEKGGDDW